MCICLTWAAVHISNHYLLLCFLLACLPVCAVCQSTGMGGGGGVVGGDKHGGGSV